MRKLIMATLSAVAVVAGLTASAAIASASGPQPTIIGGTDADQEYSFMAKLNNGCGGSLVDPSWIVTANHCGQASSARIGSNSASSGGEVVRIDRRITNPGTDLTLMHLSSPASSAPIAMAQAQPDPGTPARLLGFGCMSWPSCQTASYLQQIDLEVLPSSSCYPGGGTDNDVCISGGRGQSACHGDSGGPAIVADDAGNWILVGEAHGPGDNQGECATSTLYTGIAPYLDWINSQIGSNG